jgi:hypothetical protein
MEGPVSSCHLTKVASVSWRVEEVWSCQSKVTPLVWGGAPPEEASNILKSAFAIWAEERVLAIQQQCPQVLAKCLQMCTVIALKGPLFPRQGK